MSSISPPFVFVSYTHDSPAHKDQVLLLSQLLTKNGINVCLDRWDMQHRRDWYQWATANMKKADFVVAVVSETYRRAAEGEVPPDGNRGLQAEAALLRELLQDDRREWTKRIIPVLLPGHHPGEIPLFLQPLNADHYYVKDFTPAGAESLLRLLTNQPPYKQPALGEKPHLPPYSPAPFVPPPPGAGGNVQYTVSHGSGTTIANQGGDQTIHL